jgi:mitochondrial fission protein ELM1
MRLTAFMRDLHRRHGVHWFATTSRRSGRFIGDALSAMAGEADSPLIRFIDYRTAGPGALAEIFAAADAVVCTEDSTTMISEAVGAQLPVVTVSPDTSRLEKRELEYRAFLAHQGWYRSLPLATLSSEAYLRALGEVTPRTTSQLDELADALRQRIPELFPDA